MEVIRKIICSILVIVKCGLLNQAVADEPFILGGVIDVDNHVKGFIEPNTAIGELDIYSTDLRPIPTSDNKLLVEVFVIRDLGGYSSIGGSKGIATYEYKEGKYQFEKFQKDYFNFRSTGENGKYFVRKRRLKEARLAAIDIVDIFDKTIQDTALFKEQLLGFVNIGNTKMSMDESIYFYKFPSNDGRNYPFKPFIDSMVKEGESWKEGKNAELNFYSASGSKLTVSNNIVYLFLRGGRRNRGDRSKDYGLFFRVLETDELKKEVEITENDKYQYRLGSVVLNGPNLFIPAWDKHIDQYVVIHYAVQNNTIEEVDTISTLELTGISSVANYGEYLIVGDPSATDDNGNKNKGAVYIFKKNVFWDVVQKIQPSAPTITYFGRYLQVDSQGNLLISAEKRLNMGVPNPILRTNIQYVYNSEINALNQDEDVAGIDNREPDVPILIGPIGPMPNSSKYSGGAHWFKWKRQENTTKYKISLFHEGITCCPGRACRGGRAGTTITEFSENDACIKDFCYFRSYLPHWNECGDNRCEKGKWGIAAGNDVGYSDFVYADVCGNRN